MPVRMSKLTDYPFLDRPSHQKKKTSLATEDQ